MTFENTLSLRIYPKNWYDVCFFKDYFKNPNYPLNIDIGSGKGRFIYGRSKNIPKENFLGIERQLGRINKTSKKCYLDGRENVNFIRIEASYAIKYLVPPNYISNYYYFFPDPWPKDRHHHNRICNEDFLNSILKTLIPKGCFHIVTDHQGYFDEMFKIINKNKKFNQINPFNPKENEMTDFELLFSNRKFFRCSFTKLED